MALKLYDLAAADERVRFSPFVWRVRLALAHKGLSADTVPWRFTDKATIAFSGQDRVPVLVDEGAVIVDSWSIACHLDAKYPDRPSLLGPREARAGIVFVRNWCDGVVIPGIGRQIVLDVWTILHERDQEYFRRTREARFGATLEAVAAGADQALPAFRASLEPLRATIRSQPFLGGERPNFADYIVFAAFQWARCSSPRGLLAADDPVAAWRDRSLALFDGLAARAARAHLSNEGSDSPP
ncbi:MULTISPECIES: glutathione S-transferase family protein [Methylobacterium]|jgi:glutathione S-transferase|uniref:Glutathione S-transferase n=3 Tax=Methylobacterium TaxID=407 RepID=A0AAJ1TUB4_9HYPH|nr:MULTISPECIES: glutathione S-transferase family protein [Methylobacterium]GAN46977.1 putative glutathione S-transferase [Methylobacterium sp. ME121]MBN6823915.1 glutathione S-transferase family protein [Methylobacterium organophilum]MBP29209.1 glutathione S-transferase [Methylobacterium sp.]MCB4802335.1 glutathione S-transferase family protein [Methylobacterium brachiatum]MDE4914475.1 glutathione S-transferase family protein [Methylobacterium sp. 092160098-2]